MVYALNGTKTSQVTDREMLKRIVQGCRDDGDLSLLVLIGALSRVAVKNVSLMERGSKKMASIARLEDTRSV